MSLKVVKDLLHSYIELDDNIQKIVDTASFQRLKRIKQLSCNFLFPSTNHTRYEHSLGVMKLACDFFDTIRDDFIKENLNEEKINFLRTHLMLAAILHDIGHPPFSHLGEKFLDKQEIINDIKEAFSDIINIEKTFYDNKNYKKIMGKEHELVSCFVILKNFKNILLEINKNIDIEFICRCIIGNNYYDEENNFFMWERNICINILNSDSIDVDKLDYLMRDNHMTGEIAPKMDIKRLLASMKIIDKKIKFVAKAIPAVQSVVDSRDLLYMWVYHHHISIYIEFLVGKILNNCHNLYLENKNNNCDKLNLKKFFSTEAIAENFICDDDVYSHLRKIYVNSLKSNNFDNNFNRFAIVQLFERKFLKSLWKTIYEYKDFVDMLIKNNYILSYENFTNVLKNKDIIEELTKNIQKKLNLNEAEFFIITKYNKFYYTNNDAPIYLYLNGEDRKLSDLLPQKNYDKYNELTFFVYVKDRYKEQAKKLLIEEIIKLNI